MYLYVLEWNLKKNIFNLNNYDLYWYSFEIGFYLKIIIERRLRRKFLSKD